jgi:hypothetical protein
MNFGPSGNLPIFLTRLDKKVDKLKCLRPQDRQCRIHPATKSDEGEYLRLWEISYLDAWRINSVVLYFKKERREIIMFHALEKNKLQTLQLPKIPNEARIEAVD